MKLKVWVEVFTTQRYTEELVEVDDAEWNAMSDAEREQYKSSVFESHLLEVANGGCEEAED